jgi:hypothetical protein
MPRKRFILADTPATCSTPAIWSRAPPAPIWPWFWWTPSSAWSSRRSVIPPSPRSCACRTLCSASARWIWSTTPDRRSPPSPTNPPHTLPTAEPACQTRRTSPRSRSPLYPERTGSQTPQKSTGTGAAARLRANIWRLVPVGTDPSAEPPRLPAQCVTRQQAAVHFALPQLREAADLRRSAHRRPGHGAARRHHHHGPPGSTSPAPSLSQPGRRSWCWCWCWCWRRADGDRGSTE